MSKQGVMVASFVVGSVLGLALMPAILRLSVRLLQWSWNLV